MNKELILKAVNLVSEFNEKFYCEKKLYEFSANIEIGARSIKLSIHKYSVGFIYYENSGGFGEIFHDDNLNNFINLLTELMEESK